MEDLVGEESLDKRRLKLYSGSMCELNSNYKGRII